MKNLKTALAVLLLSGLALPASAGFSGPSKNNAATVAEAKEMPDELCRFAGIYRKQSRQRGIYVQR